MNQQKIPQFLRANSFDVFEFKMNVPAASHMGDVWERQIRTARSILVNLLEQNGTQLDDESLRTLLCETAAIVNSRPLTTDTTLEHLTSNHLITMTSSEPICIQESAGKEFNILPMCFGVGGETNTSLRYKYVRSGPNHTMTFRKEMFFSRMKIWLETGGHYVG